MTLMARELIEAELGLNSNRVSIWKGLLYRSENAVTQVKDALGSGKYFTPELEVAQNFGDRIQRYETKSIKILGTNSREFQDLQAFATSDSGWDKYPDEDSIMERIRLEAEDRGYDAIYAGGAFGLNIFNKRNYRVSR